MRANGIAGPEECAKQNFDEDKPCRETLVQGTKLPQQENDSSPRDPKQVGRGKIDKFNKFRSLFNFFAKMDLGASR